MPYIYPAINAWPYTRGKKSHFSDDSGLWITYCALCGKVLGTQKWCNDHPDEWNFQGCVVNTHQGGHEVWSKPLSDENILVIWKEVSV